MNQLYFRGHDDVCLRQLIKGWWASYGPQVQMFLNLKNTNFVKMVARVNFNQLCMQVHTLTFHYVRYLILLDTLLRWSVAWS